MEKELQYRRHELLSYPSNRIGTANNYVCNHLYMI